MHTSTTFRSLRRRAMPLVLGAGGLVAAGLGNGLSPAHAQSPRKQQQQQERMLMHAQAPAPVERRPPPAAAQSEAARPAQI